MKNLFHFCAILFITNSIAYPQIEYERIIAYQSKININKDGSMLVSEKIKVHSEGREIKRGIYRDFPTDYKDTYGNNVKITFKIEEVLRDGRQEPYHTERVSNGIRVYVGSANYYLNPGDYTYTITYKTNRQLGYFDNFDELYWNVTGNGWGFEIENASAEVNLPERISRDDIHNFGFTGEQGSKEQYFTVEVKNGSQIFFKTTRRLYAREGLTIVVQWPKGFVYEPTFEDKLSYYVSDNTPGIIIIVGGLILFIYYLIMWFRVGKDPEKGTIFPLYEPPSNLSPAAVRFIKEMGFDNKAFTAALVNLCVKRLVSLEEDDKEYTIIISERGNNSILSKDEFELFTKLKFKKENGKLILELKQKNHSVLQKSIKALKKSLQSSYEKHYFITNMKFFVFGIVISLIILAIAGSQGNADLGFALIWNMGWSCGVAFLLYTVFKTWRTALAGKIKGAALAGAFFITLFAIPFVIGQLVGFYFLSEAGSGLLVVGVILIALINIIFHHLLKAPTHLGRKIMDNIEGFKMYLSVAEQDRLNSIKEPEKTPELFEKFLPYAIALDVETEWGSKFDDILRNTAEGKEYSPVWYSGASLTSMGAGAFASGFGSSLASTISSASTTPGSSSGGGTGGSSGGGGGGGGGGGW